MRQAIQTEYFGPGNVRGSRIKAFAKAGSITVDWDHALNPSENHLAAAKALASKLQWNGTWIGGTLPDSSGYTFVFCDPSTEDDTFKIEQAERAA